MIIKCPECGRQVSERAPSCPNCGVEISGKIVHCSNCGEVYFLADRLCPSCQQVNGNATRPQPAPRPVPQPVVKPESPKPSSGNGSSDQPKPKKSSSAIFIAFILAAIICGGMFYFYFNSHGGNEQHEYELVMKSNDIKDLNAYLEKFKGVNPEHYKEVKARLANLKNEDSDWNNAVTANSRQYYQDFINKYPESPHKAEAEAKIDDIDWNAAAQGGENAIKTYLNQHPSGAHTQEAQMKLDQVASEAQQAANDATVQPQEKEQIQGLFRRFFVAMNTRNEASLTSTLASSLTFNGKSGAVPADAVEYMNSLYKAKEAGTQKNFNWKVNKESFNIQKQAQPVDVNQSQTPKFSYQVSFSGAKEITAMDGTTSTENYSISATVSPEGRISAVRISKR